MKLSPVISAAPKIAPLRHTELTELVLVTHKTLGEMNVHNAERLHFDYAINFYYMDINFSRWTPMC